MQMNSERNRISAGRQGEIANRFFATGRRSAYPERAERGTGKFFRIPRRLWGGS
jgi:hypothetical protein